MVKWSVVTAAYGVCTGLTEPCHNSNVSPCMQAACAVTGCLCLPIADKRGCMLSTCMSCDTSGSCTLYNILRLCSLREVVCFCMLTPARCDVAAAEVRALIFALNALSWQSLWVWQAMATALQTIGKFIVKKKVGEQDQIFGRCVTVNFPPLPSMYVFGRCVTGTALFGYAGKVTLVGLPIAFLCMVDQRTCMSHTCMHPSRCGGDK